jgi:hypothetical protein
LSFARDSGARRDRETYAEVVRKTMMVEGGR